MDLKKETIRVSDRIITSSTSHSSPNIMGKIRERARTTIETTTNAIENVIDTAKSITDIGGIIVSIITAPEKIFANLSTLSNLTGYDLTSDEWLTVIQSLEGNYSLQHIKLCCERVMNSRLEIQESIRIKTIIREAQQEICTSVITLSKPIYTQFQDSQIQEAYHELNSNFGKRFLELCKDTANALQECMPPNPPIPPTPHNNNRSNLISGSNSPTDTDYLNIVRKYILFLEEEPHDIIHTQQKILSSANNIISIANKAQQLFSEQQEMVKPILNIDILDCALPIETCFLAIMWCAMCYELMTTAYGDISVDHQILLMSGCNLFVILLFTLLAREGLPPALDGGISSISARLSRTGYTMFYDVVKPILDWGISFANIASEKMELNCVITKHKTWNEILSENIHKEGGHKLSMWKAMNMLHTFRIADAFLSSILSDRTFCIESLKEGLMKLSPIPLNGEENKLLTLFWNNPYKDGVTIQSKPIYGVFFNYNSEIEAIYEKYACNMGHQLNDVLIAAKNIFNEIHELNSRIGKGDPSVFDNYLVFCIAGKLKDRYSRQCIVEMSQSLLASYIYRQITQPTLT